MNDLIDKSECYIEKHSGYRFKGDEAGILYITAKPDTESEYYNIFGIADKIIADALNLGAECLESKNDNDIKEKIMCFVSKYGLLGIMTDIVTTPAFIKYDEVFLIKNPFISKGKMKTPEYIKYFTPFDKLDGNCLKEKGYLSFDGEFRINIFGRSGEELSETLECTFIYAERYDWLKHIFSDFAVTFHRLTVFYEKYNTLSAPEKDFYADCIGNFEKMSPAYYIKLTDRPVIRWEGRSLLTMLRMILALKLTDKKKPIRYCRYCRSVYICARPNQTFCSKACKNRYNVYKSRDKKQNPEEK